MLGPERRAGRRSAERSFPEPTGQARSKPIGMGQLRARLHQWYHAGRRRRSYPAGRRGANGRSPRARGTISFPGGGFRGGRRMRRRERAGRREPGSRLSGRLKMTTASGSGCLACGTGPAVQSPRPWFRDIPPAPAPRIRRAAPPSRDSSSGPRAAHGALRPTGPPPSSRP